MEIAGVIVLVVTWVLFAVFSGKGKSSEKKTKVQVHPGREEEARVIMEALDRLEKKRGEK